jgi:hypothetical protein
MGIFDRLLGKKQNTEPPVSTPTPRPVSRSKKTALALANERGDAYVGIVTLDIDPNDIHAGSFELEWNDKFIANLVRAGYQMKPKEPEDVIVDRWFQNVCRNVVLETWEQEEAIKNSGTYVRSRNIGGGRSEIS